MAIRLKEAAADCAASSLPAKSHAFLLWRALHKRKNWLFLGSDDGGEVNANLVSLLASCKLHGIEPHGYLRDLLCLLPFWPVQRVLELAPAFWRRTLEAPGVREQLEANVYRQAALGVLKPSETAASN